MHKGLKPRSFTARKKVAASPLSELNQAAGGKYHDFSETTHNIESGDL